MTGEAPGAATGAPDVRREYAERLVLFDDFQRRESVQVVLGSSNQQVVERRVAFARLMLEALIEVFRDSHSRRHSFLEVFLRPTALCHVPSLLARMPISSQGKGISARFRGFPRAISGKNKIRRKSTRSRRSARSVLVVRLKWRVRPPVVRAFLSHLRAIVDMNARDYEGVKYG